MHALIHQTSFRKATPHQSTGAKCVAQSNVNKLINHITTKTGTGESKTSVLLKKGNARMNQHDDQRVIEAVGVVRRTIIAEECDDKVVRQCHEVHCIAEEVGDGEVGSYKRQKEKL
jgi:hypothetical protein